MAEIMQPCSCMQKGVFELAIYEIKFIVYKKLILQHTTHNKLYD